MRAYTIDGDAVDSTTLNSAEHYSTLADNSEQEMTEVPIEDRFNRRYINVRLGGEDKRIAYSETEEGVTFGPILNGQDHISADGCFEFKPFHQLEAGNELVDGAKTCLVLAADTVAIKNKGYAGRDCWKNFRRAEQLGMTVEQGLMLRMQDKFSRLETLLIEGVPNPLEDEPAKDTVKDLAGYLGILYAWLTRAK